MYFRQEKESAYTPYEIMYKPKGEKNSPIAKDLQMACYASVKKLKKYIVNFMIKNGYDIKFGKDYIFCTCDSGKEQKVLVTAHIDTVQNPRGAQVIYVERKDKKHYLWSPNGIGGDDRCGVVAIFRLINRGLRPTVLFCDKEETGGLGSDEFCLDYFDKLNFNCIIELDRQGYNDLVFYDEDNEEWKKYLTELTGWEEEIGTFSDICNLYDFGCASVNLSVGYHMQHTTDEYIVLEEWENAINVAEKIITSIDKKWNHIEKKRTYNYPVYSSYNDYLAYGGDYDRSYYDEFNRKGEIYENEYEVTYRNEHDEMDTEIVYAINDDEAKDVFEEWYGVKKDKIIDVYKV